MITKDSVLKALEPVIDPEMQIGIVDLGLVYDVSTEDDGRKVTVKMTLTTPMCPYGPMLVGQVQDAVQQMEGVEDGKVDLVWDPPWDPRTMATDEAKDKLMIW
jgi:metal-sulfur cluster biosynthetic enzyme